jgi:transcriptional regulator with AAA-type ATPase domain
MPLSWHVLLILLSVNSVSYSEESDLQRSLISFYGVDEQPVQPIRRVISDEAFARMLHEYQAKLPSTQKAANAVNRLIKYHPILRPLIERVKNRDVQDEDTLRLLFVGPSGYGKTYTAKALAKYWNNVCSPRTIVPGMVLVSTVLYFYDKYRCEGFTLSALGNLLTGTAIALNYYASYS